MNLNRFLRSLVRTLEKKVWPPIAIGMLSLLGPAMLSLLKDTLSKDTLVEIIAFLSAALGVSLWYILLAYLPKEDAPSPAKPMQVSGQMPQIAEPKLSKGALAFLEMQKLHDSQDGDKK